MGWKHLLLAEEIKWLLRLNIAPGPWWFFDDIRSETVSFTFFFCTSYLWSISLVEFVLCFGQQETCNHHESCSSSLHPQNRFTCGYVKQYEAGGSEQRDVFVGGWGGNNARFPAACEFLQHTPHRKLIWTIQQLAAVPSIASIFLFCLIEFVYTSVPGSCLPTLVFQCQ